MIDFAVDLETLGRQAGCAILSIGCVAFDPDPSGGGLRHEFYRELQLAPQFRAGFTVEAATLRWWASQENRGVLTGTDGKGEVVRTGPEDAYLDLAAFVSMHGAEDSRLWAVGTDFDVAMLRWMFDHYGLKWPLHYGVSRDVRTLCDVTGFDRDAFQVEGRPHHALDDARYAAMLVREALR